MPAIPAGYSPVCTHGDAHPWWRCPDDTSAGAVVRATGARYVSDGRIWEWADGCVSIPMRHVSGQELAGWNFALFLSQLPSLRGDRDRLDDRLSEEANNRERKSLRYEQRGMHAEAIAEWRMSELFDAAAKGLGR